MKLQYVRSLPSQNADYWENKHNTDIQKSPKFELFDLYFNFSSVFNTYIDNILSYNVKSDKKALVIGVGRSDAVDTLLTQGFHAITAIDISSSIIMEMKKRYSNNHPYLEKQNQRKSKIIFDEDDNDDDDNDDDDDNSSTDYFDISEISNTKRAQMKALSTSKTMSDYEVKSTLSSSATKLDFLIADVRDMSIFQDNQFHCIFDKGCLDALFAYNLYHTDVTLCIKEIYRILTKESVSNALVNTSSTELSTQQDKTIDSKNGVFISISYAPPATRLPLFKQIIQQGNLDMYVISTPLVKQDMTYHLYVFRIIPPHDTEHREFIESSHTIYNLENNMNKVNTTKSKENVGLLTVSTSVDLLTKMIQDSAETDYNFVTSDTFDIRNDGVKHIEDMVAVKKEEEEEAIQGVNAKTSNTYTRANLGGVAMSKHH